MPGTYYLMQAVVEAKAGTVVMAGCNCALGHGFWISDSSFPIRRIAPTYVEDTCSYSKLAGEEMPGLWRTYVTRICGIFPPKRRAELARTVKPVNG